MLLSLLLSGNLQTFHAGVQLLVHFALCLTSTHLDVTRLAPDQIRWPSPGPMLTLVVRPWVLHYVPLFKVSIERLALWKGCFVNLIWNLKWFTKWFCVEFRWKKFWFFFWSKTKHMSANLFSKSKTDRADPFLETLIPLTIGWNPFWSSIPF